jgi:hypothetical protein
LVTETDIPYPPRFRHLKRLSLLGVLVLLFLGGVYLAWNHHAQSELDAFVSDAHARGRKVLLSDYATDPVAVHDNIAAALKQASGKIVRTMAHQDWENSFSKELPLSEDDLYHLAAIKRANQEALALAHGARTKRVANWGIAVRSPALAIVLPHLSSIRQLADLSSQIALYEHARGNDAEACQLASDILFEARALDAPPTFLITHLVSLGVHNLATELVFQIAPDLKVSSATSQPSAPATPQQVRALIAELLDERAPTQGLRDCWETEQMAVIDNMPYVNLLVPGYSKPAATLLKPMLVLSGVRAAAALQDLERSAAQSNYPAAIPTMGPADQRTDTSFLLRTTRATENLMMPYYGPQRSKDHWFATHFRALANCRAAATLLALRLYALDHEGHLPQSLEELAPRYLPQLPADPFRADQKPFMYRPGGADPLIYSVGQDGVDDGGSEARDGTGGRRGNVLDLIYRLKRREPATQDSNG